MTWSPLPSRGRLVRAATVTAAALGPLVAVTLLAGTGGTAGPAAVLQLAGAAVALAVGLRGVMALQRNALETRARGRSLTVGARPPGAGSALAVAIATTLVVLVVSGVIELVALGTARAPVDEETSEGSRALQEARARRDASEVDPAAGGGGVSSGVVGPGGTSSRGGATGDGVVGDLLSGAEVLRVRPLDTGARSLVGLAPLHLRGFVMDAYDRRGRIVERSGRKGRVDAGNDGWIDLAATGALVGDPPRGLDLSLAVELTLDPNGLVFAPNRLTHVRAAGANVDEGVASLTLARVDHRAYEVRATLPRVTLERLQALEARGSIEGHVALPRAGQRSKRGLALTSLRSLARTLTRGAGSDADRVLAIVGYLRSEFSYELYDVGVLSPEDAMEFVDRGAGSCTHFASFATLLLRLEGIPARVAAGYVAREVATDGAEPHWLVRKRDGHAWIEVHFEELGWLPFDPTPGDPEVGGAPSSWSPLEDEDRLDAAAVAGRAPITSSLGRMLVALGDSVARLATRPGGAFWLIAFATLTVAALMVVARGLRGLSGDRATGTSDAEVRAPSEARPARPVDGAAFLLNTLRRRGWRQARTATPTGFARDLERAHPEARGVGRAFQTILRSASTGAETPPAEEEALRAVGERIAAGPPDEDESRG
ncbi:MAG: transglutaminase-like domain-containing protein [Planctomycetota bacterium]